MVQKARTALPAVALLLLQTSSAIATSAESNNSAVRGTHETARAGAVTVAADVSALQETAAAAKAVYRACITSGNRNAVDMEAVYQQWTVAHGL